MTRFCHLNLSYQPNSNKKSKTTQRTLNPLVLFWRKSPGWITRKYILSTTSHHLTTQIIATESDGNLVSEVEVLKIYIDFCIRAWRAFVISKQYFIVLVLNIKVLQSIAVCSAGHQPLLDDLITSRDRNLKDFLSNCNIPSRLTELHKLYCRI